MTTNDVTSALREVFDPEMPVNIVDLGIVESVLAANGAVEVEITPTFIGCPALDVLASLIREKLTSAGAAEVKVRFVNDPPWSVDRITQAGREALRKHGVTVPQHGPLRTPANASLVRMTVAGPERVACPFCGSFDTQMESAFGPTRCRTIRYCSACRNQFEHMKPI